MMEKIRDIVNRIIPGMGSWTNLIGSILLFLNFIVNVLKEEDYLMNFMLGGFTIMAINFYILFQRMEAREDDA